MLELKDIKDLHDRAYTHNQVTRERASDDIIFYYVTHWDSNSLDESRLAYRGQFDVLKKSGRKVMASLAANPVQIDFQPIDENREDGADFLDGLYRTDDRRNETLEAYNTGSTESIVCGFGAWELYTQYETNRAGDDNQVIRRRPVYEANNKLYWDDNAKMQDKSDADWCSVMSAYSETGYENLIFELTGEEVSGSEASSFSNPEISYAFPWLGGQNKVIYITSFYHRVLVKDKVLTLEDPLGQPIKVRESDLSEIMDELIDDGFKIVEEKEINRYEVTKYIASGREIILTETVAGENIPIVPVYGERAIIEDEEHYEGIVRSAKDAQRLRDFQMSYLADIFSRSPRPKPIFFSEQIEGYQHMYEEAGAENNYSYLLMNRTTANGETFPPGPVGELPEQRVPQSLMISMQETRNALNDVLSPGLPKDIADIDLSGKALKELNAMIDQQSVMYQENLKHAKRRDAVVYASMASVVYDAPRKVNITLPDGKRKTVDIMEAKMDEETGDMVILNDLTNSAFDVFAEIGPSYTTKKSETFDKLGEMAASVAASDPAMHNILIMKQAMLTDGVDMEDVREYARNKLITIGVKKPETPEEEQLLADSQQNQQPDANTLLAMAEMEKAKADQMNARINAQTSMAKAQNDAANTQIKQFEAETDRFETQVNAQKVGAEIDFKRADTMGKKIDNIVKLNPYRASVNPQYELG